MKQTFRIILTLLLTVVLLCPLFSLEIAAEESVYTIGSGKTTVNYIDAERIPFGTTKLIVAEGVTTIAESAFAFRSSIKEIVFPASLQVIQADAFASCSSLERVSFQNGLAEIGDGAFSYCLALKSVTLPQSLQKIGARAFITCPLTEITIPENVTSIGAEAFGSVKAKTVNYNAVNCKVDTSTPVFSSTDVTAVHIGPRVQQIPEKCFTQCQKIPSVTIPGNVKTIGKHAFSSCLELDTVVIEEGVETIEDSAFSLTGVRELTLPASLKTVAANAFWMHDLENVNYPDPLYLIEHAPEELPMFFKINGQLWSSYLSQSAPDQTPPAETEPPANTEEPSLPQDPNVVFPEEPGHTPDGEMPNWGTWILTVIIVLAVVLLYGLAIQIICLIGSIKLANAYAAHHEKNVGVWLALAVLAAFFGLGMLYLTVVAILDYRETKKKRSTAPAC